MALDDVNFSEGDGQDFIVEIPTAVYSGSLADIALESSSSQYFICEIPQAQGGNTIFIIDD